ncbi:hypothetical protein HPULCUR_000208 [Helicostylum pulchrum]|uniref:Uncharacterized protein n=1 Tax=Helicostylum pulchrum TaxID=562976 RepID=A0ABP9XKG6_9FUNG
MSIKLSPAGKRYERMHNELATIIVSTPFVVVTSWILYKRAVLGEQPRVSDGTPVRPMGVRERDERDNNSNKIA